MNWFLGLLFILIIIYLINNRSKKKRLKTLKEYFIANWGNPKKNEYFNFYSIEQYFVNNKHKKEAFQIILERTKNDLDINELFKFIDRTSSKVGQQYLYYKLRTIESVEKLVEFDLLSNLFLTNEDLRLKSQLLLSRLNSHNSYDLEKLINDKPIEKPKYLKYVYALSVGSVLALILAIFYPLFLLLLLPIFAINLVIHYKNKEYVNYYMSAVHQLNIALNISKELSSFNEIESHFTNLSFIKRVNSVRQKTAFISFEKQISDPFLAIIWMGIELIKIQFNIDSILFYSFIDAVTNKKDSIDKLYQFIGEIDSAIATASVKSGKIENCKPVFTKKNHFFVKEIAHPLIENCISNNLELDGKSLLLTGSNMSGKTTFIRTLAINSILAQTLNVCFAKEYSAPFLKVNSSIRITDDLLDETSYYLKEVLIIKELIEVSNGDEPCLFVLDEIFKGTNTIERISGGTAILSYLNKKNNFVAVSTHDIELTDLLEKDNFELYHFTENIENDKLFFDHKLKKGKLKTRNAIKILELYNYPSEIIKNARKIESINFD